MLDPRAGRRQRTRNLVQAAMLLCCLGAVVAAAAWLLLGVAGLLWALLVCAGLGIAGPRVSPGAVLAVYQAQPLPRAVAPRVHALVEELAWRARLPSVPALYYVPSRVPNSFCVGRGGQTALAVTDGLLRRMTVRELAGVLAHEVGHLRAGDLAVMSVSDAISRLAQGLALIGLVSVPFALPAAVAGDARFFLVSLLLVALPVQVTLLQLALCRSREFEADLEAARLTGDPEGLASALEVLEATTGRLWERILVRREHPLDPVLLHTHPSTEERTTRLRALVPAGERWVVAGRPAPTLGYRHVAEPPRLRWPGVHW